MFKIHHSSVYPNNETTEFLPSTASEVYTAGEALVITGGAATKCGADAKPTHIAIESYAAPAEGNRPIAVYAIHPQMVFEVPCTASNAETAVGAKVTLHTDGLQVTAAAGGQITVVQPGETSILARVE